MGMSKNASSLKLYSSYKKEYIYIYIYIYICARARVCVCVSFSNNSYVMLLLQKYCLVSWGSRIHRLHLCRGVRLPKRVSWYDTKQSDDEVSVILELLGMQCTPLLPSLPGPLWSGVIAPDRVLSMFRIEQNCVITLNWIVWNYLFLHLTVRKQKTTKSKLNCLK